jgi:hypothetical protein
MPLLPPPEPEGVTPRSIGRTTGSISRPVPGQETTQEVVQEPVIEAIQRLKRKRSEKAFPWIETEPFHLLLYY